jgi:3-mercaptopyruvate sulfurtransferase SseA
MFYLAYGFEEVYTAYYHMYKGSWYDWFEVVSTEPIEGTSYTG